MVDSALAGGAIALVVTLRRGMALETIVRSIRMPLAVLVSLWRGKPFKVPGRTRNVTVPYGVAIAIGAVTAWIFKWPW